MSRKIYNTHAKCLYIATKSVNKEGYRGFFFHNDAKAKISEFGVWIEYTDTSTQRQETIFLPKGEYIYVRYFNGTCEDWSWEHI